MKCDWVFLKKDSSKIEITKDVTMVPSPGDGEWHDGFPYKVVYIVSGRTTRLDIPLVIAMETSI